MRITEQVAERLDVGQEYDALAPVYDILTADYDHVRWLEAIERLALQHGLRGRRVLDVACGTGKSFMPLLRKGYDVVACDLSPAMVARAEERAEGRAELHVADMRQLPRLGRFDLITCLDDALNYLLDARELTAALQGIGQNLRRGGLAVFDISLLLTYRSLFASDWITVADGVLIAWRGLTAPTVTPGSCAEAIVEVFTEKEEGRWSRMSSRHVQRHYSIGEVRDAVHRAGLRVLACRGQRPGVQLTASPDERHDTKALFVVGRP